MHPKTHQHEHDGKACHGLVLIRNTMRVNCEARPSQRRASTHKMLIAERLLLSFLLGPGCSSERAACSFSTTQCKDVTTPLCNIRHSFLALAPVATLRPAQHMLQSQDPWLQKTLIGLAAQMTNIATALS
eukprot:4518115-Amphidinium_carterae.1